MKKVEKKQTVKYITHFGVRVNPTARRAKICRETYVDVSNTSSVYSYSDAVLHPEWTKHLCIDKISKRVKYTEQYCEELKKRALDNFDINMARIEQLPQVEFCAELERFTRNRRFSEVHSLEEPVCSSCYEMGYDGCIYILVLEQYKQVYIGITRISARQRIAQHWKKNKPLDRLVFGSVNTSKISIDSFGPLDTTRIFVKLYNEKKIGDLERIEARYIKAFDQRFVLNRL